MSFLQENKKKLKDTGINITKRVTQKRMHMQGASFHSKIFEHRMEKP